MPDHTDEQVARYLPTPQDGPGWWTRFQAALGHLVTGKLSLDDLWLLVVPLGMIMLLGLEQIRPHDFWWHLRSGQIIVENGSLLRADLFSFTRYGSSYTTQYWLAEVVLYLLYRLGGLPLVIFCHAILIACGYVLVEAASLRLAGGDVRAAALATVAAMALGMMNWTVRPQSFSFLLFGVLVWILETHRARGGRVIWAVVPLFALWSNMHAVYAFGIALLAVYVLSHLFADYVQHRSLGQQTRPLLGAGVASLFALSLNPGGLRAIAAYLSSLLQSSVVQNSIIEWQPLSIRETDGQVFVVTVVLFLLLAFHRRVSLPLYLVAGMLLLGILSLYTRRVSPWFGMAAAPAFALVLATPANWFYQKTPFRSGGGSRLFNYLFVGALTLLLVARLPWLRPYLPLPPEKRSYIAGTETPVQAAVALCRLGPGLRPFNNMVYGSYLIWACPEVPVFIDPRVELYPDRIWYDYFLVGSGQFGWEKVLAGYGVNAIIVDKVEQGILIAAVRASGNWQLIYEDDHTALYHLP
ncbi:MAG: hypothetical protein IT330_02120 [Anaerolineae bacterium]|nr:hypothetical protein [Anaerolineae bacterium]